MKTKKVKRTRESLTVDLFYHLGEIMGRHGVYDRDKERLLGLLRELRITPK